MLPVFMILAANRNSGNGKKCERIHPCIKILAEQAPFHAKAGGQDGTSCQGHTDVNGDFQQEESQHGNKEHQDNCIRSHIPKFISLSFFRASAFSSLLISMVSGQPLHRATILHIATTKRKANPTHMAE